MHARTKPRWTRRVAIAVALVPAGSVMWVLLAPRAAANDFAASVATGGLRLRTENRISIERERLTVSVGKITVEYEFLNQTQQDITSEVAFPIPPYARTVAEAGGPRGFDDFRVWSEAREVRYETEVKATVEGNDLTRTLRQYGVDILSFGHLDDGAEPTSGDFKRLARSGRNRLIRDGLFDSAGFPHWQIEKIYHWRETFPAGAIRRIRHEYRPALGVAVVTPEQMSPAGRKRWLSQVRPLPGDRAADMEWIAAGRELEAACVDPKQQEALAASALRMDRTFVLHWLDYILTTANGWKGPIKQFELEIERPRPQVEWRAADHWHVSLCWDGPVAQSDADHFLVRATNLVPARDLHVLFLGMVQ